MPVTIKYIPLRERRLLYRGVTLEEGEARLISIREILTLRQLAHCNVSTYDASAERASCVHPLDLELLLEPAT